MIRTVPYTGGEKESLHAALDRHRDTVLWKADGLDDEQLRRPLTPSGTNLLGLVKHLDGAELGWFRATFGLETGPLPFDLDADETSDMRIEPHESTADVPAFYARARAAADEAVDRLELDSLGTSWSGRTVSLRWVLIHMATETARHAGHMDILRELTDGATGDHDRR
ncbi:DinB family protein [Streptomyces sp. NRRL S-350]|uniref:DinB family protein n=1 Tax=Streptomyces sp. NRRL S-350 TaxID=1463902 RepID=UPI0004C176BB|nr:DinB family protein [Streptomyces sp. NRRL S-350]